MWDFESVFSDKQPLAAGDSVNVVDVGPGDIGPGEPVILQVSLSGGATGELDLTVEASDASDMSQSVKLARYIVPAARAERGGVVLAAPLPSGCKRYLRLSYAGASGGTVTAGLVSGAQTNGM